MIEHVEMITISKHIRANTLVVSSKSIESYWLIEKEGEDLALLSLDLAISLSDYEDIEM